MNRCNGVMGCIGGPEARGIGLYVPPTADFIAAFEDMDPVQRSTLLETILHDVFEEARVRHRPPASREEQEEALRQIKHMIDLGMDLAVPSETGTLPLHNAIKETREDIVRYMLERGRSLTIKDIAGMGIHGDIITPLEQACLVFRADIVNLLLDYRATVTPEAITCAENVKNFLARSGHNPIKTRDFTNIVSRLRRISIAQAARRGGTRKAKKRSTRRRRRSSRSGR